MAIQEIVTQCSSLPARFAAAFLLLALVVAGECRPVLAQQTGTVATEQLYVRRGPGSEFPPFATLGRGDRVDVHEVRGEWARIVTGNGQTGYVRSDFLSLKTEKPTPETPSTPLRANETPAARTTPSKTPKPTRTPRSTSTPKPTATPSPERPTVTPRLTATHRGEATPTRAIFTATPSWTPDSSLAAPATVVTAVVSPSVPTLNMTAGPPTTPPDAALTERLRVEVARLTLAVEELRRRMDSQPSIEGPLPVGGSNSQGAPSGWSMAFAFGIIGALVGWILGAGNGRRTERSQRSRIRF